MSFRRRERSEADQNTVAHRVHVGELFPHRAVDLLLSVLWRSTPHEESRPLSIAYRWWRGGRPDLVNAAINILQRSLQTFQT